MRGKLSPGDRLPGARELADRMKVGISSVREALKMLESLGAVESRQGEGTYVCDTLREGAAKAFAIQMALLPQTAKYLVEFREIYETAYTHLAMRNANPQDMENIEKVVVALEEKSKYHPPDFLIDIQDELDFHRSVLYCTHNPYIIKIGEVALELFFNVVHKRLEPLRIIDAAKGHREIFEALRDKDTKLLQEVFMESINSWSTRFKQEP